MKKTTEVGGKKCKRESGRVKERELMSRKYGCAQRGKSKEKKRRAGVRQMVDEAV